MIETNAHLAPAPCRLPRRGIGAVQSLALLLGAVLACNGGRQNAARDHDFPAGKPALAAAVAPAPSPPPLVAPETADESAGVAGAEPAPARPPLRRFSVAAIGDSLTDSRSGGGGYLAYLKRHCPESRFDNFGVGGDMLNQMRRRFERDIFKPSHPEYSDLIVFGGVNDLYSDQSAGRVPRNISADLSWMYAEARRRGLRVIAITVAPWGGFGRYHNARRQAATLELNHWIEQRHAAGAIDHLVDAYALLSCGPPERLCPAVARPFHDGLHFGPLGHDKLGQALLESAFADCR